MEDLKPNNDMHNFGSLTEIMDRFAQVPYEQFQRELDSWFYGSLSAKGIDQKQLQQLGFFNLPDLVSAIYHQAEVLHLLNDHPSGNEQENK